MDAGMIILLMLAILIFAIALLYSTVGHAGASGYIAAMALFGMAPVIMKPTALTLNIIVALIGTIRFYRAGFFSWRTFWPFAVASIPAAYLGGYLTLPVSIYKIIVGIVLCYSAVRLYWSDSADSKKTSLVPIWLALILGAGIGLLSGLTGVGGGIFLSPVLLLMHWARTKETSGVSAAFILVNSIAGLLGHVQLLTYLPADNLIYWAPAALVGGWIGTELGTRLLPVTGIRKLLSVVLVLAGLKLMSEAFMLLIGR
jgi:uncharacterized protein